MRTLAHLSDLHFGAGARIEQRAVALARALDAGQVDNILVTGDVTHRGLSSELERFRQVFSPIASRLILVPGNHDRLGDDVARELMNGGRVETVQLEELYLVRIDSTAWHNRYVFAGHGMLDDDDLLAVDRALDDAPRGALVIAMLHHHPLPLPEEQPLERISTWLGLPYAGELPKGWSLLERLRGRCDLVLHGHRHVPSSHSLFSEDERPLLVFNAGSSTALGRVRLFAHSGGGLLAQPGWMDAAARRAA